MNGLVRIVDRPRRQERPVQKRRGTSLATARQALRRIRLAHGMQQLCGGGRGKDRQAASARKRSARKGQAPPELRAENLLGVIGTCLRRETRGNGLVLRLRAEQQPRRKRPPTAGLFRNSFVQLVPHLVGKTHFSASSSLRQTSPISGCLPQERDFDSVQKQ